MAKKIVLGLLVLAAWNLQAQSGKQKVELEEIVGRQFAEERLPEMVFLSDGEHYARLEEKQRIVRYALRTGKAVEVILSPDRLSWEGEIEGFSFSQNQHFILFYTKKKQVYRHSFLAQYYLYDLRLKRLISLADGEKLQAVALSPDAGKVAYVKDNNIFIYSRAFKSTRQITQDGVPNAVLNGVPDWVYEEEFAINRFLEWSPDGRFLAWVRFDETQVPTFSFPVYREGETSYPNDYVYKYPRAGERNSTVSVHVFDYENKIDREMKVPSEGGEMYLPRILWTKSAEKLCITRLNRHQNHLQILLTNPKSGLCTIVVSEENERYISEASYTDIVFLDDNQHFIYQSERDGYNHLYLYSIAGRMVKQLTSGSYDVTAFYAHDAKSKKYYYQAAKKNPLEREVYCLNAQYQETCLTPEAGTNAIRFSPGFSYSVRSFSSATRPFSAHVYDKKSKPLYALVNNAQLEQKLVNYAYSPKTFFTLKNDVGDELNAWMIKPLDFDEQKQYPLLMLQYSGPGSQEVQHRFAFGWEHYLSHLGYVVACVDGRGTGARGEGFKKCTYLQLGRYESDDQIAAAKYFANLPFIDAHRVGIWGWSYGGFVSALCMSRGNGVFKAGIAVAPVTHFKFYDSIYTERFMRSPHENPEGYDNYAPLMLAKHLQGHLLLCHGTADDNVHYQNTLDYSEALVQAGKSFEMQIYRNRNHNISGEHTRLHLYRRFVDFLEKNL